MDPIVNGLADILRQMRASARISQLELALRLGVSQRHVSFVELGRARPSRNLILSWAREAGASVDERNAALVSAGFAPAIVEFGSDPVQGSAAFRVLSDMLAAHDPFPGLIFDADWMIRAMNEAGQWLCGIAMADFLAGMDGPPSEMDMIASVAHPGGLLATVRNAAEVGFALLNQLRAEQLTRPSLRPRVDRLEESLRSRFGAQDAVHARAPGEPYLQLVADTAVGPLSFLLVQTVFGLPQNVTRESLRTELWFPVDEATRRVMTGRAACE
ncbi:helix-turn-helix domain-containing protein [Sphingosinicella terrae]|uniref:helix-turn-helix domain-containing protein n=1 Tax=Sphingosinicella terrae TaxID=2172047 RepID=UPI000E0D161B|nr:helix-turn-helix domain-containing protein [Sphingosinicella terrae]